MNAAAGAENTYTGLATADEVALQNGLLSDCVSYTGDVTTAFGSWVTTVSNGVASQCASYHGGGEDVTAVANAWRDYDQDVSDAWKSFVDGDAAAFETYGQNTATAAQTVATNIAAQNVSRVSNIASEVTTYNSLVTPALKSLKLSVLARIGTISVCRSPPVTWTSPVGPINTSTSLRTPNSGR